MSIVDKSSAGLGVRQFHIDVAPGEVSTVALLPGDPFRVPLVAEYLDDPTSPTDSPRANTRSISRRTGSLLPG